MYFIIVIYIPSSGIHCLTICVIQLSGQGIFGMT